MAVSEHNIAEQFLKLLDEAFENPQTSWRYFTDASPTAGYFGALRSITARDANRAVSGTSIAAQIQHLAFSMQASSAAFAGQADSPTAEAWRASWQIAPLDDDSWNDLQDALRAAYRELREAIARGSTANAESFGDALGVIAHVAYHLGAVQQKLAAIKTGP